MRVEADLAPLLEGHAAAPAGAIGLGVDLDRLPPAPHEVLVAGETVRGHAPEAVEHAGLPKDVPSHDVVHRLAEPVIEDVDQFGVLRAPWGLAVVNAAETFAQRAVGDGPLLPAHAAVVHMHGPAGVEEYIVLDHRVPPSPEPDHTVAEAIEEIAVDVVAGHLVIQVDAERAGQPAHRRGVDEHAAGLVRVVEPVPVDVVERVVADHIAPLGQVAAAVEHPAVAGDLHAVMHVVVLEHMIVAGHPRQHVGAVVEQIVLGKVAAAVQSQRGRIGVQHAAHVVHVVVDRAVAAGRQRLPVASAHHDAALPHVVHVIAEHRVVCPAHRDAAAQCIAHLAASKRAVGPARYHDRDAGACLDGEAPHGDVRRAGKLHDRVQSRGHDGSAAQRGGRPEVKVPFVSVVVPFPGGIEFLEHVPDVVAPAGLHVVLRAAVDVDDLVRRVDGFHADVLVHVVVPREQMDLGQFGSRPRPRSVAAVVEVQSRVLGGFGDQGPVAPPRVAGDSVGPARERHAFALEEQLEPRRVAADARTPQRPDRVQTEGCYIGSQDTALVGTESRDRDAAEQHRPFLAVCAVHDRSLRRARVLAGQLERVGKVVHAAAHVDRGAAGERPGLAQLAQPVAGALQRSEGTVAAVGRWRGLCARPCVIAAGRDVEIHSGSRLPRPPGRRDQAQREQDRAKHRVRPAIRRRLGLPVCHHGSSRS